MKVNMDPLKYAMNQLTFADLKVHVIKSKRKKLHSASECMMRLVISISKSTGRTCISQASILEVIQMSAIFQYSVIRDKKIVMLTWYMSVIYSCRAIIWSLI